MAAISWPSTPGSMSSTPARPCTTTALLWQNSLSWISTPSATCFSTGAPSACGLQPLTETVVPSGCRLQALWAKPPAGPDSLSRPCRQPAGVAVSRGRKRSLAPGLRLEGGRKQLPEQVRDTHAVVVGQDDETGGLVREPD